MTQAPVPLLCGRILANTTNTHGCIPSVPLLCDGSSQTLHTGTSAVHHDNLGEAIYLIQGCNQRSVELKLKPLAVVDVALHCIRHLHTTMMVPIDKDHWLTGDHNSASHGLQQEPLLQSGCKPAETETWLINSILDKTPSV